MTAKRFYILFCVLGYNAFQLLNAQQKIEGDTTMLNIYKGKFSQQFTSKQGSQVKDGVFNFQSEVMRDVEKDQLNKLTIQGTYKDGFYHGYWGFSELNYDLTIENIVQGKSHVLDYSLNGSETRAVMRFNLGKASGRWMIDEYKIENSRQKELHNNGFIFCNSGYYNGEFSFKNDKDYSSVQGQLNADGFLNGPLLLRWRDENNREIREERIYQDGFLLIINRYEGADQRPFMVVEFNDVQQQLIDLQKNTKTQIKISDAYYGVHFDNGYRESDLRLQSQVEGNALLERFLSVFDRYLGDNNQGFDHPEIRFTKRFVFDYGDDFEQIKSISARTQTVIKNAEQFLNTPSNILYAAQSDSISRSMTVMNQVLQKSLIIQDAIHKIESGFFNHRNRDIYYSSGVKGLDKNENLYYKTKKDSTLSAWTPSRLITNPNNLLDDMETYLQFLEFKYQRHQSTTALNVADLAQSSTLVRIDSLIVHFESVTSKLYGSPETLSNLPYEKLNFEQKIFLLSNQKKLTQLRKNYLSKIEFTEKKDIGNQYIEIMSSLSDNYDRLLTVGQRQKQIDSLFTIFQDNPFDYRMVEIPILSQIKEKGLLLFRHYAEQLYSETRVDRFEHRLNQLELLLDRLKYFAENHNDSEVMNINRAVRRESVPSRIERIFNIGNDKDI